MIIFVPFKNQYHQIVNTRKIDQLKFDELLELASVQGDIINVGLDVENSDIDSKMKTKKC